MKYSSIDVVYCPVNEATSSYWTYFPYENLEYHRILFRHNFLEESHGHWREINTLRRQKEEEPDFHNEYAYLLNTRDKPQNIKKILEWAKSRSIIGLGRWREWEHINSVVATVRSLNLVEQLG